MRQYEGLIHDKLVKLIENLQKRGVEIYLERRGARGASYKKGIPDVFIVYKGIHYEIEEKQPDGKRSTMQEKWEEKCHRLGIPYLLVDSAEDTIMQIIYGIGIKKE